MTVERLENGDYKTQSGIVIPSSEAYELFHFMEHEYNKSEVVYHIGEIALVDEDYPEDFEALDVPDDLVDELAKEYEHLVNNSFDNSLVQSVIDEFKEDIIASVSKTEKEQTAKLNEAEPQID